MFFKTQINVISALTHQGTTVIRCDDDWHIWIFMQVSRWVSVQLLIMVIAITFQTESGDSCCLFITDRKKFMFFFLHSVSDKGDLGEGGWVFRILQRCGWWFHSHNQSWNTKHWERWAFHKTQNNSTLLHHTVSWKSINLD